MANKEHNRIYQIYELKDALEGAIANYKTLIAHQGMLADIVEASDKAEELKDFASSVREDLNAHKLRLQLTEDRLEKAKALIAAHEAGGPEGEASDKTVTLVIEALNLGMPEPEKA
jgi:uncharacterized protein YigA (DUF484 family)